MLSTSQAAIDRRVLINTVDINGKFKLNATTNDILKIQKVEGALLYDALELSFNMIDKINILKLNNVDILSTLNLKASASNVYTKEEINNNDMIYANALSNKADKTSSYSKTEIDSKFTTSNLLINSTVNISFIALGDVFSFE